MDYKLAAKEVYQKIGGEENIISAAHCATRLRLVIADNSKCDKNGLENIEGVKGVFIASGQLQIIFGTGIVNKVYDEFTLIAGIKKSSKEEVKKDAVSKQSFFMRLIKVLGDIFVPIIPAIVASGLLMGFLEGFSKLYPEIASSGTYAVISLFSNASFVFLPILIAMSAAKAFGGNIYLGAVIGMIMIHPSLLNAWSVASAESIPTASVWFGLYNINLVGYQGHVIPIVIAVWFMAQVEKKLHKIVPEIIDLFVTPLVTVLVTGYLALTILGPIFSGLESGVLDGVKWLISLPFGLGAFLTGAIYAPTVVAGVHHMYNALEAGMLSADGVNIWMPIATAANVAQGGAALALAVKTKNKKIKALALPASLSAFLGITEPAIFGVNIRYGKPFIAGCIGGAFGALFSSIAGIKATAYGVTGLFGILITTDYIFSYILLIIISTGIAFIISWLLYKEEETKEEKNVEQVKDAKQVNSAKQVNVQKNSVYSPLKGKAILLSEVKDETFASEVLGKGMAIVPSVGRVVAPFNGKVESLFPTKHGIGMTSEDGIELLIHIGMNTVELNGKYYKNYVEVGDEVKIGQTLIEFEIDQIQAAGYDVTTPVIVTNAENYTDIKAEKEGNVVELEKIIAVK